MAPPTLLTARPLARWLDLPVARAEHVAALQAALNLPVELCAFLVARGFADAESADRFLHPRLSHLHPPRLMRGMDRATERIVRAIRARETILIHGDYDVDGITSTALLTRVLRALGATVVPFVPNRLTDGYDLTDAGVQKAIVSGAKLVITCDCGTSAHTAVNALNAAGIDVIITDHHLPSGPLPPAYAVLNPRQPGCDYPDKDLVAAGVVFKLAASVTRELGGDIAMVVSLLDLVALATVADVAPLRGENRVFVRRGLQLMRVSRVPGLKALVTSAGLDAKELTAGRVGFILAPRINATGRIASAMLGVELFLTDSPERARAIAFQLAALNEERREKDRRTLEEAREMLAAIDFDSTRGIVLARGDWHPGVIGIVASRVVEQTGRPALLIAIQDGVGKGSGRSIPGFDLHGALTECKHHFLRFGGHRAAAGITIAESEIPAFAESFRQIANARLTPEDLRPELRLDIEIPLASATEDLFAALKECEPHGIGNPAPTFVTRGVRADVKHDPALALPGEPFAAPAPRIIGETGIRTRLLAKGAALDAIAWDFAHRIEDIDWTAPMDVAFKLERDDWNGIPRMQAKIVDVRQSTG